MASWGMCIPQAPGLQSLPAPPSHPALRAKPGSPPSAHSLAASHRPPPSCGKWPWSPWWPLTSSLCTPGLRDLPHRQIEPSKPVGLPAALRLGTEPGLACSPSLCPDPGHQTRLSSQPSRVFQLASGPPHPVHSAFQCPLTLQSQLRHLPLPTSREVPHTPKTGSRVCWASPLTEFCAGAICGFLWFP